MDNVALNGNQKNHAIVENIDILDIEVEVFLENKLGKNYNKDVAVVMLNNGQGYDHLDFIYSYFLFSWRVFVLTCRYNNNKFDSEVSLIYSKLGMDNIQLTSYYLKNNTVDFFYYITAWNIEYLSSLKDTLVFIDEKYSEQYVNAIPKLKTLAPDISMFLGKCKLLGTKRFSYLVYGIEAEVFNKKIENLKKEINSIYTSDFSENMKRFISGDVVLTQCLENQDSFLYEIKEINNKLEEKKHQFNFVLLSSAFDSLKKTKNKELIFTHMRFVLSIIFLVAIPIYLYWTRDNHKVTEFKDFFVYAPLITLEVISFYFMRLFYLELKSIKSQLLQIHMRLSLCEFIHDYVEKREKSEKSDSAWKAFESLIFSPIQASEDKIPAVLDGADAIAELAGKIMARKS